TETCEGVPPLTTEQIENAEHYHQHCRDARAGDTPALRQPLPVDNGPQQRTEQQEPGADADQQRSGEQSPTLAQPRGIAPEDALVRLDDAVALALIDKALLLPQLHVAEVIVHAA